MDIDIDKFVKARKRMKISQVKLSEGICTQTTLSKFERNQQIPAIDIVGALCERLGLTLDDVFSLRHLEIDQEKSLLQQALRAAGIQNYDLFKGIITRCQKQTLSFSGYQAVNLLLYFESVVWSVNLPIAKEKMQLIDVKHLDDDKKYLFYALTAYYYYLTGFPKRANEIMSELSLREYHIISGDYTVYSMMALYVMTNYQCLTKNNSLALSTASKGIKFCHKNGGTFLLENLFWVMINLSNATSKPDFIKNEMLINARVLAKLHGNKILLKKLSNIMENINDNFEN
ncbi:helix-turn-helix domain-containing protein [Leuconostoc palmae]|uniref:helix-turn-helix domain-containing protein n=1 Tax=Leuconostoc palmae TaxID=501487 RepID=UPI001C7CC8AF|nr:helix-turn-helix transcriptional regulator [Leuconostoc palmae]